MQSRNRSHRLAPFGASCIVQGAVLISAAVFGVAALRSADLGWGLVFLFGVAFGTYQTACMALGMDFSDPRVAAFIFARVRAIGSVGIALGQPISGAPVDAVASDGFAVLAALNLLPLPIAYWVFRRRESKAQVRQSGKPALRAFEGCKPWHTLQAAGQGGYKWARH